MLYISRMIKNGDSTLFGVYDTDDGREELLTYSGLDDAVAYVKIEGSLLRLYDDEEESVYDAEPVQIPEFKKPAQDRVRVLYDVEFTLFKNGISLVKWWQESRKGSVIRLSSIAERVYDCAFLYCPTYPTVTFILDNKISLSPHALAGFFETRAVLDIREVTNLALVEQVYHEVSSNSLVGAWKQIIDNQARRDRYRHKYPM